MKTDGQSRNYRAPSNSLRGLNITKADFKKQKDVHEDKKYKSRTVMELNNSLNTLGIK